MLGVSLRSPGVRDQLQPQDGFYSVLVRDSEAESVRVIGAIQGVLVAPEDPAAVVEAMASPEVHPVRDSAAGFMVTTRSETSVGSSSGRPRSP